METTSGLKVSHWCQDLVILWNTAASPVDSVNSLQTWLRCDCASRDESSYILSCSLPSVCCVLLLLPTAVGRRAGASVRSRGMCTTGFCSECSPWPLTLVGESLLVAAQQLSEAFHTHCLSWCCAEANRAMRPRGSWPCSLLAKSGCVWEWEDPGNSVAGVWQHQDVWPLVLGL